MNLPPETIDCVECGGVASLLTQRPEDDPFLAGDIIAYRCAECWDRFDLVFWDDSEAEPG
jgi:DNA-directed RNA polymerase subunit RPC12/RpoP